MLILTGCPSIFTSSDPSASPSGSSNSSPCRLSVTEAVTMPGEPNTAVVYGTVANTGDADAKITGASSPAFKKAEARTMVDENGTKVSRPTDGWTVQARSQLRWSPTTDFLLFAEYNYDIADDQQVPITITCGDGATVQFTAKSTGFKDSGGTSGGSGNFGGGSTGGSSGDSGGFSNPQSSTAPTWQPTPSDTYTYPDEPTYYPTYTDPPTFFPSYPDEPTYPADPTGEYGFPSQFGEPTYAVPTP
jgi:copper(I)-binding protein